jgi:hypothetical protein
MLEQLIKSATPVIWLETKEYFKAEERINTLAERHNKRCIHWDVDDRDCSSYMEHNNPFEAVIDTNLVLCLYDFDKLITDVKNWRQLINSIPICIKNGNIIIIVSPIVNIPIEISHYITLCKMELPNQSELESIAREQGIKNYKALAHSGLGMTEFEFKSAIAADLDLFNTKKQIVEKNKALTVYNSTENIDELYGVDVMKNFVLKMIASGNGKGILILGVPGSGKSEFAKRLGAATNRLTINLDFGSMMGKYVGETEQLTKAAFDTINTISESIVFIDEVEKGLSGVTTDSSGVSIRQGGNFLKWMQDKSSDTYVIATANNIEALPSEYLRAGRWDAIFFIDMPDKSTKEKILELYKNKYNITDTIDVGKLPYTGAEIEVLCRLASTLSVSLVEASKFVCPISITNKQQIDKLRNFAKTRAVNAANYEIISSKIKM